MLPQNDERQRSLSRERLVEAGLSLVQEDGLDGLSMRALADRLDVKASSLYWHVRDRRELVELLGESILASVRRPVAGLGWRPAIAAIAAELKARVGGQNDAGRILLEAPDAMVQSDLFRDLRAQFTAAGLRADEASEVAAMLMTHVISGRAPGQAPVDRATGEPAELAVDSGSRGVTVRAGGPDMEALVRVPPERSSAAPAIVRGEKVVVRRLRGVGRGELELNPRRAWRFHVQAPTWNIILDAGGLDLRQVHVDSGAAKLEIFLPRPNGVVPIHISSGAVSVAIHRPRGTAAMADLSAGVVRLRLDDFATRTTLSDTHWESDNASAARDRFELRISSGAVRVELDEYDLKVPAEAASIAAPDAGAGAPAVDILLDGVQARVASRRTSG